MHIHKRQNYGSGEIQHLGMDVIHYLGTGSKAFISGVQRFGKGPGFVISLVNSTLPQQQNRFLTLISFYGSHTIYHCKYYRLAWRINCLSEQVTKFNVVH